MKYFPDTEDMSLFCLFFMLCIYGYILLRGAGFVGEGGEMLLLIWGPGFVGGIILPIVNVIPDCIVVIISGSGSGSIKEVQHEIQVGLGTLMGSSICLLTLRFAVCNLVGLRDLKRGEESAIKEGFKQLIDVEAAHSELKKEKIPKLTKFWSFNSGCLILNEVPHTAKIMLLSCITFFVIEIPALIFWARSGVQHDKNNRERPFILVSTIIAFGFFLTYCITQYINAEKSYLNKIKYEEKKTEEWKKNLINNFSSDSRIEEVFRKYDLDNSGSIETKELKNILKALGLTIGREEMKKLLEEADQGEEDEEGNLQGKGDGQISFVEFKTAIKNWISQGNQKKITRKNSKEEEILSDNEEEANLKKDIRKDIEMEKSKDNINNNKNLLKYNHINPEALNIDVKTGKIEFKEGGASVEEEDELEDFDEEDHKLEMSQFELHFWAFFHIVHGTILCGIFTEPIIGVITGISKKMNLNAFLVSLLISPFILNSREMYESIPLAKRKTKNSISMLLYQINGTVTMNNTLVLGVFMCIIYGRNLPWIYNKECICVIFINIFVGCNALTNTIKLWQSCAMLTLYPISIIGLYLSKMNDMVD